MFAYIKGMVTEIYNNYIVVENNNIGYLIYTGNPYKFELNKEVKIYLYNHVKEDENSLYGFKTLEEHDMFMKLISVKGLGCKMALPIIAAASINELEAAINTDNIAYLKKFPKIGDKVARQIILDLKGKLASDNSITTTKNFDEVESVLINLGYKKNDIKNILKNLNSEDTLEVQVKEALKLMLR